MSGNANALAPTLARRPARGLGAIAIIMVLVVMAVLAAGLVRLGSQSHTISQQDLQSLRAGAASRAGVEWGLYQAFKGGWTSCSGASQTLDLRATLGMLVTVSCQSTLYNEGESAPGVAQTVRLYTLDAVACNGNTSCPDASAAGRAGYAERRRVATATN